MQRVVKSVWAAMCVAVGMFMLPLFAAADELPYDYEIEYLKGDKAAYINLNYDLTWSNSLEVVFDPETIPNTPVMAVAGARHSSSANWIGLTLYQYNMNCDFFKSSRSTYELDYGLSNETSRDNVYTVLMSASRRAVYCDGICLGEKTNANADQVKPTSKCMVFTIGGFNSTWSKFDGKIFSVKITNEVTGETVFDLIPVRKGEVGYLYDKVSGGLFGNIAGKGAFELGPDKPRWDTLVITAEPAEYGEPNPPYGFCRGVEPGVGRELVAPTDWVSDDQTVASTCVGYKIYVNDVVYAEKTFAEGEPKTISYDQPDCPTGARLVWQLKCRFRVTVASAGNGTASLVTEGDGWFDEGDRVTVRAMPAEGYGFGCWEGDTIPDHKFDDSLSFTMDAHPHVLTATFRKFVYVSKTGDDGNGGTSWDDALATIPAALEKDETPYVLVGDGIYDVDSGIAVTNGVTVSGLNDRGAIVRLATMPSAKTDAARCVFYLNHPGARLTNLAAIGGWTTSITSNNRGRGISLYDGQVDNCSITNNLPESNSDTSSGGGVKMLAGVVRNCLIQRNVAKSSASTSANGGGVWMSGGLLENCDIRNNQAQSGNPDSGGGVYATGGTIRNCLIVRNTAVKAGSGAWVQKTVLENCTISGNYNADSLTCTGLQAGSGSVIRNTVVYGNTNKNAGPANVTSAVGAIFENTLTTDDCTEMGVIVGDPAFVDAANGDWHVGFGPCVDAGTNQAWMVGATDLDGNERVQNNVVDLGCYETEPNDELMCSFDVMADGAFDVSSVTLTATVNGADPAKVAYAWALTDDAGNVTTTNLNGVASVTLTVPAGTYAVALQVSDGTKTASVERSGAIVVLPSTVYVSKTGANIPPYDTLAKATPDLNVAFRSLTDGMTVVVDDGTYTLSKEQTLNFALTVRSLNGPEKTTLSGMAGDMPRAFVLQHAQASVSGFTFANFVNMSGSQPGEALRLAKAGAVVSNCVFRGCAANFSGGAISMTGGLLVDCLVTNCWALTTTDRTLYGQAIQAENADSVIERCVIRDCGLSRNSLTTYSAVSLGGGAQMRNSVVAHNRSRGEGGVRLTGASVMENCTVVDNIANASNQVAGVSAGSMASVVNTIIWNNTNTVDEVIAEIGGDDSVFDTCCTNNPCFRRRGAPWRLSNASPCLNAGKPLDWMEGAVDLYGNPRILYGQPDIGAVESPYSPGIMLIVR